jgi:hypothetical protein
MISASRATTYVLEIQLYRVLPVLRGFELQLRPDELVMPTGI